MLSLFTLFIFCFMLLLARLSLGPINLDFLTPKMEEALQPASPHFKTSIAHTQLVWRNWKHPCEIELVNFCVQTPQKADWLKIEHVGISLQLPKLLKGELAPKYLRLYRPKVILEQNEQGQYLFGFMDSSSPEQEFSFEDVAPLLALDSTGTSLGKLNSIHKISILEANIAIKDKKTHQHWTLPNASLILHRHKHGFQIDLTLVPLSKRGHLHAQVKHSLGKQNVDLSLHFRNVALQALLGDNRPSFVDKTPDHITIDDFLNTFQHWNIPLNGKITLSVIPTTLQLLKGQGSIDLGKGNLDLSIANLHPLPLEAGNISFTVSPHEAKLTNASLLSEEMLLQLSGKISSPHKPLYLSEGLAVGQTIDFQGKIEDFLVDHLGALWPQNLAVPARDWLTKNFRKGIVTESTFILKGTGTESGLDINTLQGKIAGEAAEITYLEGMPSIENIKATATFDKKGFDITVYSGNTKGLEVQEGKVFIKDLDTDDENLALEVKAKGAVGDLLDTLNHKPLEFATYAGLDPAKVKGSGEFKLHMDFPLLKTLSFDDVKMKLQGNLKDVSFDRDILGTLQASLTKGTMTCTATEKAMTIQGSCTLNQIPSSATYSQYFDSSSPTEFQLRIESSPLIRDLKSLGFDCSPYGEGSLKTQLTYTYHRDKTGRLTANFDLTPAVLRFSPLMWEKKRGERGSLSFDLLFQNNSLSKMENLKFVASPYSAKGELLFSPEKTIKRLHLSEFKGPFTDTQVILKGPRTDAFEIVFKGKSLNLENFLAYLEEEKEKKDYTPTDIKLYAQVDQLRFGEGKIFQNVLVTADLFLEGEDTFWKEVNLRAKAGNETGHYGALSEQKTLSHVPGGILFTLIPHPNNLQTLTVEANDAGQFLKNLSIYDDIQGGQLSIKATRTNHGPYEGSFELENFDAQKVPLVTRFAAVLSPIGIVNLFSERGNLSLEHFKCRFLFDENLVIIRKGVGKSLSLGFTVGGKLDRANRKYNLQGNIIPARFLNTFLSNIPGLGTLLNGGKGEGLFGMSYTVTGAFDAPEVSINPLSLLTPGFLRNLFSSEPSESPESSENSD